MTEAGDHNANTLKQGAPIMTTQTTTEPRYRNGINIDQLFGTLDAIKGQPSLGTFQFRATNRWLGGAHNRSTIREFYGAGQEDRSRAEAFVTDAGEPAILLGTDTGPNPAEFLLHALAACLTTSIVYVAAARGVELESVASTIEGDLDVRGGLGIDKEVRNGFQQIRITFDVKANASAEKIREVVERARARSVVFDSITAGVPVDVAIAA
jgi:uncharacterized OsmC-like protein